MLQVNRRLALAGGGALAVAVLARAAAARAQTPAPHQLTYDNYVLSTLKLGRLSITTSELARERASSADVKQFAALEIAEQQTIASVLAASGVTAGDGNTALALTPDLEALVTSLTELQPGEAFDLAYVEGQVTAHLRLLETQRMLTGDNDPSIEAITARLAEQAVQSHIFLLNLIQQQLGVAAGAGPQGAAPPAGEEAAPASSG